MAQTHKFDDKEQLLRLWYHECCRVFMDRLIDLSDREKFRTLFDGVMDSGLQVRAKDLTGGDDQEVVFSSIDLTNPDAEEPPYEHIADRKTLKAFMEQKVEDYNGLFKKSPMSLVMFKDAIELCCRVLRILKQPRGNALLVGVGGSGRHCQTRLASFVGDLKCFQIEISKQYKHQAFLDDLARAQGVELAIACLDLSAAFDLVHFVTLIRAAGALDPPPPPPPPAA